MGTKRLSDRLRAKIIAEAQSMSFGLIAQRHGLTRHQVAGLIWRHNNPPGTRVPSPRCGGGGNKKGTGYAGPGYYPALTLINTR